MKFRSDDIETIRGRMAQIRRKHHEEVREVLAGAETVAGWGRHIRVYSWAALGAAAVAGIWIATSGRKKESMQINGPEVTASVDEEAIQTEKSDRQAPKAGLGWPGQVANFVTTVAVRAAQNYAVCCLEEWITPRRSPEARKPDRPTAKEDLPRHECRAMRPDRVNGDCEKLEPILVAGGFEDARSSTGCCRSAGRAPRDGSALYGDRSGANG